MDSRLKPSMVLDTYWKFGAERLAMYLRRLAQPNGPWTDDPILRTYRFTNSFRAADRVSQYLIREIQYDSARSPDPAEVIFRTLLFKRSEERRVGQECVSPCRSRCAPYHKKKKQNKKS